MAQLQFTRTYANQLNPWGRAGGFDPQRSDLWLVWFRDAVNAVRVQAQSIGFYSDLTDIATYEVKSLSLPELRVKSEMVRRDSRPFNTPSWDDALDPIKMTFLLDSVAPLSSNLVLILNAWRALVRAGRGAMSSEPNFRLNDNYRIDYAFDVTLQLLSGGKVTPGGLSGPSSGQSQPQVSVGATQSTRESLTSSLSAQTLASKADFGTSRTLVLRNCWLSAYKINELAYDDAKILTLDATFYADDVLDRTASNPTGASYVAPEMLTQT